MSVAQDKFAIPKLPIINRLKRVKTQKLVFKNTEAPTKEARLVNLQPIVKERKITRTKQQKDIRRQQTERVNMNLSSIITEDTLCVDESLTDLLSNINI